MQRDLVPGLDHLVWAAGSLAAGNEAFVAATGVKPEAGGRHEGFGTHNALVGLDEGTYFEIIAADPSQAGGPLADAVGKPDPPQLIAWAVRVADAELAAEGVVALGLQARVVPMERATPAGDLKKWKVVVLGGHPHRGAVPFFIDWLDTPHPGGVLASSARLETFVVASPLPDELRSLLRSLGLGVEVHAGREPRLSAVIAGPQGLLEASGAASGLMHGLL